MDYQTQQLSKHRPLAPAFIVINNQLEIPIRIPNGCLKTLNILHPKAWGVLTMISLVSYALNTVG
jgi:hypothetical protein